MHTTTSAGRSGRRASSASVRRLTSFATAAVLAVAAPLAYSAWPDKPIRLVVGFPAGGSADASARPMATHMLS